MIAIKTEEERFGLFLLDSISLKKNVVKLTTIYMWLRWTVMSLHDEMPPQYASNWEHLSTPWKGFV